MYSVRRMAGTDPFEFGLIEKDFAGGVRVVAMFAEEEMATSVCRLLNMAVTVAINEGTFNASNASVAGV
jgi:hypothetical protein